MAANRAVNQYDLARVAGAAAVVMIHVSAAGVLAYGAISLRSWWLANLLDSASRWAVPLFIMVSGALLLDPAIQRPFFSFFRRRTIKIVPPLIFWTILYFIWLAWWRQTQVSFQFIETAVLSGNPYDHLYFLYLILGLYSLTPMLRVYVMHASRRNAYYCLLVLFSLSMANDYITTFWSQGSAANIATQFLPYVGYYLAGYYIRDSALLYRARKLLLPAIVFLIITTAVGTYVLTTHLGIEKGVYFYDYTSVTIVPLSICLMAWLNYIWPQIAQSPLVEHTAGSIKVLAAASFGIYLVHPIFLDIIASLGISPTSMYVPLGILYEYLLTLCAAFIATASMRAVPILRDVVP